jgi:uncharacterized hydantoinase/oxoprolinase family protein
LLVDVGSTTTDVIPLRDGVPVPKGKTDTERLRFDRQQALIVQSMREVAASLPAPIRTVILSGSSHSLAGWAWITFTADIDHFVVDAMRVIELSKEIGPSASAAACAYALAVLATEGSHAWL